MEIAFDTKELRDLAEIEEFSSRELGNSEAESFRSRLADLQAAESIYELPLGSPKHVIVNGKETFILTFAKEKLIYLVANHLENPMLESGSIDWSKVNRIKIMKVSKTMDDIYDV